MWGIARYQWLVLFAAWLGWGFDVFDGLLFNYVAPNCIPTLLHLRAGSPEAIVATRSWTGVLTSLLLLGWAAGGVLFGFASFFLYLVRRTRTAAGEMQALSPAEEGRYVLRGSESQEGTAQC